MDTVIRASYAIAGVTLLVLGIVGLLLPLVPGMVFIVLAAAAFARSVPSWHRWLLAHPWLGPPLARWERDRCLDRRTKWVGSAMVLIPAIGSFYALRAEPLAAVALAAVLLALVGYLHTRATCPAPVRREPSHRTEPRA